MIPNPYPGTLFAMEGIDGGGKSVQLKILLQWLRDRGLNAQETKEPNKAGLYGKLIYKDLDNPNGLHHTNPKLFQSWYAADSKQNIRDKVIQFISNSRGVVVSDRFRPSMVYGADNTGIEELMRATEAIMGDHFIWPDAIFIFDISVDIAIERLKQKGRKLDGHENIEKLTRVRDRYLTFARMYHNCHVIPAEDSVDVVAERVKHIAIEVLKQKGQYDLPAEVS